MSTANTYKKWAIGIFIGGCFFPFFPIFLISVFGKSYFANLGPVGDWISGSMTPLLTAASFLMVLAAFWTQSKELELQREELTLTRLQMEEQTREFHIQNIKIEEQKFENTFFNLLAYHKKVIDTLRIGMENSIYGRSGPRAGISVMEYFNFEIKNYYLENTNADEIKSTLFYERLNAILNVPHWKYKQIVGIDISEYARSITGLIEYVFNYSKDLNSKKYIDFLKSQLHSAEISFIFYTFIDFKFHESFTEIFETTNFFSDVESKNYVYKELFYQEIEDGELINLHFSNQVGYFYLKIKEKISEYLHEKEKSIRNTLYPPLMPPDFPFLNNLK